MRFKYISIERIFGYDLMFKYRTIVACIELSHRAYAFQKLCGLAPFPSMPQSYQLVSDMLKPINAMAHRTRMSNAHSRITRLKRGKTFRCRDIHSTLKSSQYARFIALERILNQERCSA